MAEKKESKKIKVRDLNPSKDAKGGAGSAGGGGGTKGPTPTGGGVQGGTGAK